MNRKRKASEPLWQHCKLLTVKDHQHKFKKNAILIITIKPGKWAQSQKNPAPAMSTPGPANANGIAWNIQDGVQHSWSVLLRKQLWTLGNVDHHHQGPQVLPQPHQLFCSQRKTKRCLERLISGYKKKRKNKKEKTSNRQFFKTLRRGIWLASPTNRLFKSTLLRNCCAQRRST